MIFAILLSAHGVCAADWRAPSAEIARVKAERTARTRAEKALDAAVQKARPQLDETERGKLVGEAKTVETRYGSDGSVEVTLAVEAP
jgi:hypothetical protein